MAYIKVTPEELRLYRDSLENIYSRVFYQYENLVQNLSDIDFYMQCANNDEIKNRICKEKDDADKRFLELKNHIQKLDTIASDYEEAERMNINESEDID